MHYQNSDSITHAQLISYISVPNYHSLLLHCILYISGYSKLVAHSTQNILIMLQESELLSNCFIVYRINTGCVVCWMNEDM